MVIAPQFSYISTMICVNIPDSILKRFDKIIKVFLWEGVGLDQDRTETGITISSH